MIYESLLMKLFGPSLATVRYGGVFCGILALVVIYFILSKLDKTAGLIALILGVVNFPLIIYNRLALMENLLLVFILCLALILLAMLQKPRDLKLILAFWVVFFLGYLTKPLIVFFIFLFFAIVLQIEGKTRKHILSFSLLYIVLLSTFLWFFWISNYPEDWQYFQQLNIGSRISFDPQIIMQNYTRYIARLKLYEFMPALYTIALLEVLRGISGLFKKRRIAQIQGFFICWLVFGWLFSRILCLFTSALLSGHIATDFGSQRITFF
ncbi:MAG: glycosyltransferase family 39 protein, partial [Candidatus Hodarchaeota archaeon]